MSTSQPDLAVPLLLTHGWPGSVVEFHKVTEPLTGPTNHGGAASDAFHVIAPSLPGYGFSGKPTVTGWGVDKIASGFAELMSRLGSERGGHPEDVLSRDELLDNIMLYWINGNAASSGRLYWESFGAGGRHKVDIPTGFAVFLKRSHHPCASGSKTRSPTSCTGPNTTAAAISRRSKFPMSPSKR